MNILNRSLTALLGATVGLGLLLVGTGSAASAGEDRMAGKREDSSQEVVAVDDDAKDDDNSHTRDNTRSNTGNSNDNTNSRHSKVSRDQDRSRGDLTKDQTRDGKGGKKRDFSRNMTNDRSRKDTR